MFSVVIPVYNPGEELIATLNSVERSSLAPGEVIIVDDYSSVDPSALLFGVFKTFHVRVIRNRFKKGISGALNTGICESKWSLIARIDSGDLVTDDRFRLQVGILGEMSDIDLIVGSMCFHRFEDGVPVNTGGTLYAWIHKVGKAISPFSRAPHPTWMFRKSAVKRGYNSSCLRCEDYCFLLDNFRPDQVLAIQDVIVSYDVTENLIRFFELRAVSVKVKYYWRTLSSPSIPEYILGVLYWGIRVIRLLISLKK